MNIVEDYIKQNISSEYEENIIKIIYFYCSFITTDEIKESYSLYEYLNPFKKYDHQRLITKNPTTTLFQIVNEKGIQYNINHYLADMMLIEFKLYNTDRNYEKALYEDGIPRALDICFNYMFKNGIEFPCFEDGIVCKINNPFNILFYVIYIYRTDKQDIYKAFLPINIYNSSDNRLKNNYKLLNKNKYHDELVSIKIKSVILIGSHYSNYIQKRIEKDNEIIYERADIQFTHNFDFGRRLEPYWKEEFDKNYKQKFIEVFNIFGFDSRKLNFSESIYFIGRR